LYCFIVLFGIMTSKLNKLYCYYYYYYYYYYYSSNWHEPDEEKKLGLIISSCNITLVAMCT